MRLSAVEFYISDIHWKVMQTDKHSWEALPQQVLQPTSLEKEERQPMQQTPLEKEEGELLQLKQSSPVQQTPLEKKEEELLPQLEEVGKEEEEQQKPLEFERIDDSTTRITRGMHLVSSVGCSSWMCIWRATLATPTHARL